MCLQPYLGEESISIAIENVVVFFVAPKSHGRV